jgi:hypothetical protein
MLVSCGRPPDFHPGQRIILELGADFVAGVRTQTRVHDLHFSPPSPEPDSVDVLPCHRDLPLLLIWRAQRLLQVLLMPLE